MNDFESIAHAGGHIEFNISDKGYQFGFRHQNSCAAKVEMISTTIKDLSLQILMISDSTGMFGALCSNCNQYFRTSRLDNNMHCPYCNTNGNITDFLTKNQEEYFRLYKKEFMKSILLKKSRKLDLDALVDSATINSKFLEEEKQQSIINCSICKVNYDIVGVYGYCPICGHRNNYDLLKTSLNNYIDELDENFEKNVNNQKIQIKILKEVVEKFECFGKDVFRNIDKKDEFKRFSFQRIEEISKKILKVFSVDIFRDISQDDYSILIKLFNVRHLYVHNNGIADQKYLDNTSDASLKLGQIVRIESKELRKFVNIVSAISETIYTLEVIIG